MKNLIKITTITTAFLSLTFSTNVSAQIDRSKTAETEGRNITGTLVRAEQSFHFERQKFTTSISELGIRFTPQSYRGNIIVADANKAIIITTPKTNNLKIYTGGISYSNGVYSQIICESLSPTTQVTNPLLKGNQWSCGAGFVEIK